VLILELFLGCTAGKEDDVPALSATGQVVRDVMILIALKSVLRKRGQQIG
jgi:hypothetical protein